MADVSDSCHVAGTAECRILPRNVMIDPCDVPRQAPEATSSHWSPQPLSARISPPIAPILVSARISPPIAVILASPRIFPPIAPILVSAQTSQRSSPIPLELSSPTSLLSFLLILLPLPLLYPPQILKPSVLSQPISDRSTRADLERPLQTYANVVAILSERLKTRFCVFYDREYTLDVLRFALPRERNVDLGQYVLLRNYALR